MDRLEENRKHQADILAILVQHWNPQALPSDQAAHEYECFVPDIYRILLSRVSREQLARHIYDKDVIALSADRFDYGRWAVAEKVADLILGLKITK